MRYWKNDMSDEDLNKYWNEMLSYRMDFEQEVWRLTTVLKGFFLENYLWNKEDYDVEDYLSFWGSKRPYGNKDVPRSIVFNLGWDRDWLMCEQRLPESVEDEAIKLHEAVGEKLKEEWDLDSKNLLKKPLTDSSRPDNVEDMEAYQSGVLVK